MSESSTLPSAMPELPPWYASDLFMVRSNSEKGTLELLRSARR